MIDTDKYEGQIEFDDVLKEIEVGVDISEGNYDILRYYRDEYKDLLTELKRLRKELAHYQDNCTIVWMRDDVLTLDDTLTDEQVSWVLERMEHKHDACLGISWDTIEFWISEVKKE